MKDCALQSTRVCKIRIILQSTHQSTFERLKAKIASPNILALPVFDQPLTLHNDASKLGAGVALTQESQDVKCVNDLASHNMVRD